MTPQERRDLQKSMLAAVLSAMREALVPADTHAVQDEWDDDSEFTGGHWKGPEVIEESNHALGVIEVAIRKAYPD